MLEKQLSVNNVRKFYFKFYKGEITPKSCNLF